MGRSKRRRHSRHPRNDQTAEAEFDGEDYHYIEYEAEASTRGLYSEMGESSRGATSKRSPLDPILQSLVNESEAFRGLTARRTASSDLTRRESLAEQARRAQLISHQQLGTRHLSFGPLNLNWVYGRTESIGVYNLVGTHKHHVLYAASNVLVLYDFHANYQWMLQGHKNKITSLCAESQNRYFASGDAGHKSSIIIWDLVTGLPFKTVVHPHHGKGVRDLSFCGTHDFLASIGAEDEGRQSVNIYDITKLEEIFHPETTYILPSDSGFQEKISFHPDIQYIDFFASYGAKSIVFYTWINKRKLYGHFPQIPTKWRAKIGKFTKCLWSKQTNYFLAACSGGFITVWDTPKPLGLQDPPDPDRNIKEFYRAHKISENGITAFHEFKEFFVIGESTGLIKIFDQRFTLLRFTKHYFNVNLRPITFICFNRSEDFIPQFKSEMQNVIGDDDSIVLPEKGRKIIKDYTRGGTRYHNPSETTLVRTPLNCPDFVFSTEDGNAYYCHLAEGRIDHLVYGTPGRIIAMDVSPTTRHVALITESGDLQHYDYSTHKLIFNGRIFSKNQIVSCMKFHPTGSYAMFGTKTGQIYSRTAFTWQTKDSSLDNTTAEVVKIIFSEDGVYMTHTDKTFTASLYQYNTEKLSWTLKGKYRAHQRKIVDILFQFDKSLSRHRLFTLGKDRLLVEYDVEKSSILKGIHIVSLTNLDPEAIPLAMHFDDSIKDFGPYILTSNTRYKLKYVDPVEKKEKLTFQGPCYGLPINQMLEIYSQTENHRKFLAMVAGNRVGIFKIPVDGNPFKFMAIYGHPKDITYAAASCDKWDIFTIAEEDNCCFIWEPNLQALDASSLAGGTGIVPFKQLLDADTHGGKSWYADLENIFYYFMFKRIENQTDLYHAEKKLPISNIPIMARACGYFPSEYNVELMMSEARFRGQMTKGEPAEEITFDDFVKLFANFRDCPNTLPIDLKESFEILGQKTKGGKYFVERDELIEYVTTVGEKIEEFDLPYLCPGIFTPAGNKKSVVKENFVEFSRKQSHRMSVRFAEQPFESSQPDPVRRYEVMEKTFSELLLPEEAMKPMSWIRGERVEENDISHIPEGRDSKNPWKETLDRWEERDNIKYFTRIIEFITDRSQALHERLMAIFEMAFYAQHNCFPSDLEKQEAAQRAKEDSLEIEDRLRDEIERRDRLARLLEADEEGELSSSSSSYSSSSGSSSSSSWSSTPTFDQFSDEDDSADEERDECKKKKREERAKKRAREEKKRRLLEAKELSDRITEISSSPSACSVEHDGEDDDDLEEKRRRLRRHHKRHHHHHHRCDEEQEGEEGEGSGHHHGHHHGHQLGHHHHHKHGGEDDSRAELDGESSHRRHHHHRHYNEETGEFDGPRRHQRGKFHRRLSEEGESRRRKRRQPRHKYYEYITGNITRRSSSIGGEEGEGRKNRSKGEEIDALQPHSPPEGGREEMQNDDETDTSVQAPVDLFAGMLAETKNLENDLDDDEEPEHVLQGDEKTMTKQAMHRKVSTAKEIMKEMKEA